MGLPDCTKKNVFVMKLKRIIITTSDIVLITGKTERYARNVIKEMREDLCRQKHQLITIQEYCDYMGLDLKDVEKFIL